MANIKNELKYSKTHEWVKEVKRLNGSFSMNDAVEWQKD